MEARVFYSICLFFLHFYIKRVDSFEMRTGKKTKSTASFQSPLSNQLILIRQKSLICGFHADLSLFLLLLSPKMIHSRKKTLTTMTSLERIAWCLFKKKTSATTTYQTFHEFYVNDDVDDAQSVLLDDWPS